MTNREIIQILKRTSKLMQLHGENDFKVKSYTNALFNLERMEDKLSELPLVELEEINGVGKSIAAKIDQINQTDNLDVLKEYLDKTPAGVIELMDMRGIGIKKLQTLWHDYNIDSKQSLDVALKNKTLTNVKGMGSKTLESIQKALDFSFVSEGKMHYANAQILADELIQLIESQFSDAFISTTGKLRRKWEVLDQIEILVGSSDFMKLNKTLKTSPNVKFEPKLSGPSSWRGRYVNDHDIAITIYLTAESEFYNQLLLTTGSGAHIAADSTEGSLKAVCNNITLASEQQAYTEVGLEYCPPEIREGSWELPKAAAHQLPKLLETEDLQGIIHNHTTYSDGQNSLLEMAQGCMDLGYSYLGISDHSKAAYFYANGLFEERVAAQQKETDELNKKLAPFRIFKGIEADILAKGELDYDKPTLESFEFVVASIHSGLSMDKIKATERLITAIANPYTTILGHMTGRLLLMREGYPVDHEAIIKACAEFNVIIEINAHPNRLDIDWRWVHLALDHGVVLSVNPDAHSVDGYKNMKYGVFVGQKGGLTKEQTFNAWPLDKVENYLLNRRKLANF